GMMTPCPRRTVCAATLTRHACPGLWSAACHREDRIQFRRHREDQDQRHQRSLRDRVEALLLPRQHPNPCEACLVDLTRLRIAHELLHIDLVRLTKPSRNH